MKAASGAFRASTSGYAADQELARYRLEYVPVADIRPEEGLDRKRDRQGHRELCRSIGQFGVLTPITVRRAPDGSGDFLLIKGQGRTLACRLLGIDNIPAVIVDDRYADTEKVQQFLVENVARLRLSAIDRALLIAHARQRGEETATIATRFGVSAATVRRLEAQLDGASSREVAALRARHLNLAMHAVIARHVQPAERDQVIHRIAQARISARELDALLAALGWQALTDLGRGYRHQRLALLEWACRTLSTIPRGEPRERINRLALVLPIRLPQPRERHRQLALAFPIRQPSNAPSARPSAAASR